MTFDDDLSIDLKYADHTTLIPAVFEHLQLSTTQLEHASGKLRMKINVDKCKIISQDPQHLTIDGAAQEKVDSFCSLLISN